VNKKNKKALEKVKIQGQSFTLPKEEEVNIILVNNLIFNLLLYNI